MLNLALALIGAVGFGLFFAGLYTTIALRLGAGRRGLFTSDADFDAPEPEQERLSPLEALDRRLYRARLPVSAGEFITTSAVISLVIGGVMYLAVGLLAALVIGLSAGAFLYYSYLDARLASQLDAYEAAMPHALRDLRAAFRTRGLSPVEALRYVAEQGPEPCREDFAELAAAFAGASIDQGRVAYLLGRRGSYALDRVAEALLQFHSMPQRLPEIIDLLVPRLRKEARVRREMRANVSEPRRQLVIVALMPFVIVLFFRLTAPGYAGFYGTPLGQLLIIVAFLMDIGVFLAANAIVRRIIDPMPYRRAVPERRRVTSRTLGLGGVPGGEDL
jgi:Flp pilus assembly protein TadB